MKLGKIQNIEEEKKHPRHIIIRNFSSFKSKLPILRFDMKYYIYQIIYSVTEKSVFLYILNRIILIYFNRFVLID